MLPCWDTKSSFCFFVTIEQTFFFFCYINNTFIRLTESIDHKDSKSNKRLSFPAKFDLPKSLHHHSSEQYHYEEKKKNTSVSGLILSCLSTTFHAPRLRSHLFLIHLRNPLKTKRFRLFSTFFSLFYLFPEFSVGFKSLTFPFPMW